MQTQQSELIISEENIPQKGEGKAKQVLVYLLGLVLLCIISLFIFEIFPRFIILDIPPPDINIDIRYGGGWETTTYEVKLEPVLPRINSRVFIWRQEMVGLFDKNQGINTWNDIIQHFDTNLEKLGWIHSEIYTPCHRYLPEARFLPRGQNGYISYRQKEFRPNIDFKGGSFLCLAVWSNQGEVSYNVVLLSVNPSPLNTIASFGYEKNKSWEFVKNENH